MKHPFKNSLLASTALFALAVPAQAAVILSTNATWPTSSEINSGGFTADTTNQRTLNGTRQLRQAFQVSSGFTLDEIYFKANNYANLAFSIKFYSLADINASTWSATTPTQIGTTIIVPAFGSSQSGLHNLHVGLSQAEQLFLAATTGSAGYAMEIAPHNTTSSVFSWSHSSSSTIPGNRYIEDGASAATDFGMALVVIPEPTTALLGSLGMLFLLRRRR